MGVKVLKCKTHKQEIYYFRQHHNSYLNKSQWVVTPKFLVIKEIQAVKYFDMDNIPADFLQIDL